MGQNFFGLNVRHYPSFETIIKSTDRTRLLEVHRSLRSILSNMMLFFGTALAIYVINYFFGDYRFSDSIPVLRHASTRWLAIVPVLCLLEIVRKYHDDLYIFAAHSITHFEGRLSLNSSLPSVKYADIVSLSVKQDIFGRILDYGDVLLDTSGENGVELTVAGVRGPHELMTLIEEFRIQSVLQGMTDRKMERGEKPQAAANE